MAVKSNEGYVCKKDGKQMFLIEETEKMSNGAHRAVFYYKCPVCGYKIEVEQVTVSVDKDQLIIRRRVKLS
jgi:DNA-directed RNA polymerase subunit RPC12/RpoP